MDDTETKPQIDVSQKEMRPVLRIVFSGQRAVDPPPIIRVPRDGLPFGREVTRGIVLDDTRVSRHHSTVRRDALGRLSIVDERSKNGTYVNGERVERRDLENGDVISIGDSCLTVSEEPIDAAAVVTSELIGDSAAMRRARSQVDSLGATSLTILLTAETGCGKEVVARALHAASRLSGAFVAVNCAAIPESLFESQLFGHTSKAFTGATAHDGFFRAASGGTLFLDEIGELAIGLQPKLLRAIQERSVIPLGATRPIPCPVRIIAATNKDLTSEVDRGTFRGDLLARLFEARIELPPLRERREDILPLFLRGLGGAPPRMTHALAEALLVYDWRYNVREVLAMAREASVTRTDAAPLDLDAFRTRLETEHAAAEAGNPPRGRPVASIGAIDLELLKRLLIEKDGNVAEVARTLQRSRKQIYRWIDRLGISVTTFRS